MSDDSFDRLLSVALIVSVVVLAIGIVVVFCR
jgi:hypothetical protein